MCIRDRPKALAGDGSYTGNPTVSSDNGSSSLGEENAAAFNDIDDYSDLGWEEQTWNFTCSTTETSTWACLLYTSSYFITSTLL